MEERKRSTLRPSTVLFFVFAILCVVAFLIVILVKSCEADHEEDQLLEETEQMSQLPTASNSGHIIFLG